VCGLCAEACPPGARKIVGKEMTAAQVLDEVEKDSPFYWNTGGGITLSGGEPTMQAAFSSAILKGCRERSINTAMETCGYATWDTLSEMLRDLDILYIDIKHMSSTAHEQLTAKSNVTILENIRRAAASFPDLPITIRIPIVPGINDSDDNIGETAQFVRNLGPGRKIELLPYHRLGIPNYEILNRHYSLPNLQPPTEDRLRTLEGLVRSFGAEIATR
jgi:pyruvate formate lyase activating enzyme